jgi:hypothetical protein
VETVRPPWGAGSLRGGRGSGTPERGRPGTGFLAPGRLRAFLGALLPPPAPAKWDLLRVSVNLHREGRGTLLLTEESFLFLAPPPRPRLPRVCFQVGPTSIYKCQTIPRPPPPLARAASWGRGELSAPRLGRRSAPAPARSLWLPICWALTFKRCEYI